MFYNLALGYNFLRLGFSIIMLLLQILQLRAQVESLNINEGAFQMLGEIGSKTTLRFVFYTLSETC